MLDAISKETRESSRERGGGVEYGHALLHFVTLVPYRQKKGCRREEASLRKYMLAASLEDGLLPRRSVVPTHLSYTEEEASRV